MPDASDSASKQSPQPPKTPVMPPDAGHVPMTEEFDSAKWSLPPAMPIVLALVGVAIVVGILSFAMRAKPVASGKITNIATFDQQNAVLVGVRVTLENKIEKQLWIRDVSSELETADGQKYPDHAAPATDAERYLQSFSPEQRASVKAEPLREELKIPPGGSYTGFLVFSYPVSQATFDTRKSLTVRVAMYDQPTVVIKQP